MTDDERAMTEVDRMIARLLGEADELFEDAIRRSMTQALTVCGEDADIDLEMFDAEIGRCRDAWARERGKIPGVVKRALADHEAAGAGRRPGC